MRTSRVFKLPVNGRAENVFEPPKNEVSLVCFRMWGELARNFSISPNYCRNIQVICVCKWESYIAFYDKE